LLETDYTLFRKSVLVIDSVAQPTRAAFSDNVEADLIRILHIPSVGAQDIQLPSS